MAIRTELIPLDDLLPDERNPRRHSAENIRRLVSRIQAVGFTSPVLVDARTRILAAGHRRRLALVWLREHDFPEPEGIEPGWRVPARVGEWSELQQLQVLIGDNGLGDELEYDDTALAGLLADLQQYGGLEGVGVSDEALDRLIGELAESGGEGGESGLLPDADPDEIPDDAPTRCQVGDLWALGEHRLLCGDSTDAACVARLMGDDRLRMVWTDPPYGIAYVGKTKDALTIQNDALNEAATERLTRSALELATDHAEVGAVCYVACPAGTLLPHFIAAVAASGFTFKHSLVWVKDQFVFGRCDYHYRHETILYSWIENGAHYFAPERTHSSVFEVDRPKRSEEHPTMKPIALVQQMVENSSRVGEVVYDCFGGSGTTMIACEATGRRARLIEISPQYADVILARWERATGKTATLLSRAEPP